jgi:Periplasmic binding protein-like domain
MLTRTDRPSAIVAANNLTTLGVMQAVSALGFDCPNDVSVVGIDDSAWNIARRSLLTSVAQPIQAIGRQAIDWLIERLSSPVDIAPRSIAFAPALLFEIPAPRVSSASHDSADSWNGFLKVISSARMRVDVRQDASESRCYGPGPRRVLHSSHRRRATPASASTHRRKL